LKSTGTAREERTDLIIEAAQKRFGIFGVEKTSMREVAEDLHMSKGSIYYYFPDKENLYKAVIEKEQSQFLSVLGEELINIKDPSVLLQKYAMKRLSYFKTLLNLSRIRSDSFNDLKPLISGTILKFREKEKEMVVKILDEGKRIGQFKIEDTNETAMLFLDLLRGLRSAFLSNKKLLTIDDKEYNILSKKVEALTDVFIKGLMYTDK
jgi:AcrR family transcriptional regulator